MLVVESSGHIRQLNRHCLVPMTLQHHLTEARLLVQQCTLLLELDESTAA